MDISSLMGNTKKPDGQAASPAFEYTAQAASPYLTGEVKVTIGEHAFTVSSLFDTMEVRFAEVFGIVLSDYVVIVKTMEGDYFFSRMGQWAQPFCDALRAAYHGAFLRAFFLTGKPLVQAVGDVKVGELQPLRYACVSLFDNCIVILPPEGDALRIPLCFSVGMERGDHSFSITQKNGERYAFSRLGFDTLPLVEAIEGQIRSLREKAKARLKALDPSLTDMQTSKLAKIMPLGAAAPMGRISAIAPGFTEMLEQKIAGTRVADSFRAFSELVEPGRIWVGVWQEVSSESDEADRVGGADEAARVDEASEKHGSLYLVAPSPSGQSAAVEFALEDTATFVYRTNGDFEGFADRLVQALEASAFKREVIRLTDEELLRTGREDYYMAAKRTDSLRFVRSHNTGRIIHSNPSAWRANLAVLWDF